MHGHDTEKQIFFYEHEFYVFSNFSSFKLEWKGETWMTSEHAYHSEKFDDPELLKQLKETRSAHDAMVLAYANKDKYRKDWAEVKLGIMKEILRAKVEQHPYVKKKLIESGDKELVEDSWRDDFWAGDQTKMVKTTSANCGWKFGRRFWESRGRVIQGYLYVFINTTTLVDSQ